MYQWYVREGEITEANAVDRCVCGGGGFNILSCGIEGSREFQAKSAFCLASRFLMLVSWHENHSRMAGTSSHCSG